MLMRMQQNNWKIKISNAKSYVIYDQINSYDGLEFLLNRKRSRERGRDTLQMPFDMKTKLKLPPSNVCKLLFPINSQ